MPNIFHNYELYLLKPFARPLSPTCRSLDKSFAQYNWSCLFVYTLEYFTYFTPPYKVLARHGFVLKRAVNTLFC